MTALDQNPSSLGKKSEMSHEPVFESPRPVTEVHPTIAHPETVFLGGAYGDVWRSGVNAELVLRLYGRKLDLDNTSERIMLSMFPP